jgi:hypothetical protein
VAAAASPGAPGAGKAGSVAAPGRAIPPRPRKKTKGTRR